MSLLDKEKYFNGTENEPENVLFLREIKDLRKKHLKKPSLCKSAFLIIDMQNFFFNRKSHAFIPSAPFIVDRVIRLRERCKELNVPVIYTRHVNSEKNAGQMIKWWRDILKEEDKASMIIDELSDISGDVIIKSQYDAFYGTGLEEVLRERNISQIIISGVMTHLCCETTAREAFVRGFDVFFGIDITATYNRVFHISALRNLSHGFAVPLTYMELLQALK